MKILLVAGARPNFMKIAAIVDAIGAHNQSGSNPISYLLVHTGQHYDEEMSHIFFRDLSLPKPDIDLEVGSSSQAQQTAEIMKRFEPVLLKERPDVVLVVGDVNSTVACSLVASKILYPSLKTDRLTRPLIAHVEAGLRSFDRTMPEEINRIITDGLSDFLFITEKSAAENLIREGIPEEKIHFVGNTMVDTLLKHRQRAEESTVLSRLGLELSADKKSLSRINREKGLSRTRREYADYAVVTLHRPSNVDNREPFHEILEALSVVAKELLILFPVHPRTMNRIKEFQFEGYFTFSTKGSRVETRGQKIRALEPLGYLDFLCLMSNAKLILTDSGGIQEETTVLGVPCVTLRENTERPVTLTHGTNVLAGAKGNVIISCAFDQLNQSRKSKKPRLWDGRAGQRIIGILAREVDGHRGASEYEDPVSS